MRRLDPQIDAHEEWRRFLSWAGTDSLLVVQQPRRTFLDLEVDGKCHDPTEDAVRTACLQMPTLRLTEAQFAENRGLTAWLRERGYCPPRK